MTKSSFYPGSDYAPVDPPAPAPAPPGSGNDAAPSSFFKGSLAYDAVDESDFVGPPGPPGPTGPQGLQGEPGGVISIFSRTGVVTAQSGDYTAAQITNAPAGSIAAVTVQAAIDELATEKAAATHTHAQSDVTNLVTDLAAKAPLASPTFTGNPVAPTPAAGDNDTSIATTAFVRSALNRTFQLLTSGTSATYTTPAGCKAIFVRMLGGGGGGGGGAGTSTGGSTGGAGGTTSFNSVTAPGGSGGAGGGQAGNVANGAAGGAGGAAGTGGTVHFKGFPGISSHGASGTAGSAQPGGGQGGGAAGSFSGAGGAGDRGGGGGGGGATPTAGIAAGPGGGSGAYTEYLILNPSTTYTYTVGAAGTAGTAGTGGTPGAGGVGGAGLIVVEEYY